MIETNLFIFSLFPEQYSTSLTFPLQDSLTSFLWQRGNGKRLLALKTEDRRVLVGRLSAVELPTGRQSAPAVGKELSLTQQH